MPERPVRFARRLVAACFSGVLLASCGFAPAAAQMTGAGSVQGLFARGGSGRFPAGFMWGVATAGFQVEGGDSTSNWAAWERAGHTAHRIGPAIDHWNRYEEDADLAKDLSLNAVRLSLEWARIEPEPGRIDAAAVAHYHAELDALRARGLQPIVTLSHFAYPAWLDPADGTAWETERMPIEFARYAAWAAGEFGGKIKYWITLNEPNTLGACGYLAGMHPPGKHNPIAYVRVMENQLKAHQAGYDAIHAHDADAAVSINPIIVHRRQDEKRLRTQSRFLLDEYDFLDAVALPEEGHRTVDFIAFNYFYAHQVYDLAKISNYNEWPIYPQGMYQVAKKLHARYKLPLFVAENGIATDPEEPRPDGWTREAYLVNHLTQLSRAVDEGVPVLGYMHWTLADNYEWGTYAPKFGLYGVDRRDPSLRRFKTPAADIYGAIARANRVPEHVLGRYAGQRN